MDPLTPERRRAQTREHLLKAAAEVFSEKGFHMASVDDVAIRAGFTKGAVYSNFSSKDDLIVALLETQSHSEMFDLAAVIDATEGHPEEHLSDFVTFIENESASDSGRWTVLFTEFCLRAMRDESARAKLAAFERRQIDAVADVIASERTARSIEAPETPQQVARVVTAMTRGLAVMRVIDPDAVDGGVIMAALSILARAFPPGDIK